MAFISSVNAQSGWKTDKDGHLKYEYKPSSTPAYKSPAKSPASDNKSTTVNNSEKEKEKPKEKTRSELIEEEERKEGFYEDRKIVRNYNYQYGYVASDGRLVIEKIYTDAKNFSEGLAAVQLDGNWGYINDYGRTIIPFKYYSAGSFKDGKAVVYEKYAVKTMEIDKNGEEIIIKVEEAITKPEIPAAPAVLLNENFSVRTNDWPVFATAGGTSASIIDGRYVLGNLIDFNSQWYTSVPMYSESNFTISLSTRYLSGNATGNYGLLFGAEGMHSGYRFEICKNGTYKITNVTSDNKETLKNWTLSPAIKKGPNAENLLSVKRKGLKWIFLINSQPVITLPAHPFYGDKIGVLMSGIQEASFDNLKVKSEL